MESNTIQKSELLEEDHKVEDLLDFSVLIRSFSKKIKTIKNNSLIGLVGRFGSGKSTMLYQLYKDQKEESASKWVVFDAWKYPDRKDLWEGFILDFADQIGERKKIKNKIDGKSTKSQILDVGTDVLSAITDKLPDLNFLDKFTEIFKQSPATRVFEIQQILRDMIEKLNKELYIIVEDIDRSGDKGVFFLETLRNFVKENEFAYKIIVIVPIGTKAFQDLDLADSYAKCLDYHLPFTGKDLDYRRFITEVFNKSFQEKDKNFITQIDFLFKRISQDRQATIRELKKIIRLAVMNYDNLIEEYPSIDLRLVLYFTANAFFKDTLGNHTKGSRKMIHSTAWGYDFLIWVANTVQVFSESQLQTYVDYGAYIYSTEELLDKPLVFNTRNTFENDSNKGIYFISDFYLKNILNNVI